MVNWTNISSSSLTRNGLNLTQGRSYYVSIKARNEGGLWSLVGTSNPVEAGLAPTSTPTNTPTFTPTPTVTNTPTITPNPTATLQAQVFFQGRPPAPNARLIERIQFEMFASGSSTPVYSLAPITDSTGSFSLNDITPGVYDITVKGFHSLRNALSAVTIAAGANTLSLGTLKEGDANNDNYVSLVDFSILVSSFGLCQVDPGFDIRADFNADTCVSLLDFSLLATNFSQAGADNPSQLASSLRLNPSGPVQLRLLPDPGPRLPGSPLRVSIQVEAGFQSVDGIQASLSFDPRLLRLRSLSPGSNLPLKLASSFDNAAGTLHFAAGALSAFPSGSFSLATLEFEILAPSGGTGLAFQFGLPGGTDATWDGQSVLGAASGATLVTAPYALAARPSRVSQIDLSWNDPSTGENGFEIQRSLDGVSAWTTIAFTSANATQYTDTHLPANSAYAYRIRALFSSPANFSNTAAATTYRFETFCPWIGQ